MADGGFHPELRVDWKNFPTRQAIVAQFNSGEWRWQIEPTSNNPATPFHITLELVRYLYRQLLPSLEYAEKPPKNPSLNYALKTDLRAIAYFSWHREDHVFLARRVYPSYFDFLTYSHVPQGWGALGIMINEIRSGDDYKGYTSVKNIKENTVLLPYLREADRLNYRTVLAIPAYKTVNGNGLVSVDQTVFGRLVGALVLYFENEDGIKNVAGVGEHIRNLSTIVGDNLASHLDKIQSLTALHHGDRNGRPAWHCGMASGKSHDGEIYISLSPGMDNGDFVLNQITETLLRHLNCLECIGVKVDSPSMFERKVYFSSALAVQAVESSEIVKREVNEIVRRAIGATCATKQIDAFIRWKVEMNLTDQAGRTGTVVSHPQQTAI